MQLGFLQAKNVGAFPVEPLGESFPNGGAQAVYIVCDDLHIIGLNSLFESKDTINIYFPRKCVSKYNVNLSLYWLPTGI